jgi:DNA-directed RNA polymerase specialized sigma24 family protein
MESLTDEDREILEASYGRKDREAAAFLGIPKSTYQHRLKQARERAEVLLKML